MYKMMYSSISLYLLEIYMSRLRNRFLSLSGTRAGEERSLLGADGHELLPLHRGGCHQRRSQDGRGRGAGGLSDTGLQAVAVYGCSACL